MKIAKGTKSVSIYYHDTMKKSRLRAIQFFVDNYLEKQIELHDMFDNINSFINYKNPKKNNVFEPEGNIMGLDNLLLMAGVVNLAHVEIFKKIAYSYFSSEGTARERAEAIHKAWRKKALELRDQKGV